MQEHEALELVRFQSRQDEEAVAAAAAALLPELRALPGFREQRLWRDEQGGWILSYRWDTLENARQSNARMAGSAALAALMRLVDDPSAIAFTYARAIG